MVHSNGSKYWRLKYRFLSKEKVLPIGIYPHVSLADARVKRDNAKKLLANNVDPSEVKQAKNTEDKLEAAKQVDKTRNRNLFI